MAFRILQPCHRTWSSLEGEGSVRQCGECGRDVHEIVDHTDSQISDLLAAGKRLCVLDARPARRTILAAAVAITSSHLSGQALPRRSSWKVLVVDHSGARVVGAEIRLLSARKESLLDQKTDESGSADISFDWQEGMTLEIYSKGFTKAQISLKAIPEATLRVVLEVASMGQVIAVPEASASKRESTAPERLTKWERFKGIFRLSKN
jgi:hypothetical protein